MNQEKSSAAAIEFAPTQAPTPRLANTVEPTAGPLGDAEACLRSLLLTHAEICDQVSPELRGLLHQMKAQAARAIGQITQLAASERDRLEADAVVCGAGEHDFVVRVTIDATASRWVRARGDTPGHAASAVRAAVGQERVYHFELDKATPDEADVSVTGVRDADGNEFDLDDLDVDLEPDESAGESEGMR